MDRNIYKSVYMITVLSDGPLESGLEIETVVSRYTYDDLLGQCEEITLNEEVPKDQVLTKQLALGGDGTFFVCYDCEKTPCECGENEVG